MHAPCQLAVLRRMCMHACAQSPDARSDAVLQATIDIISAAASEWRAALGVLAGAPVVLPILLLKSTEPTRSIKLQQSRGQSGMHARTHGLLVQHLQQRLGRCRPAHRVCIGPMAPARATPRAKRCCCVAACGVAWCACVQPRRASALAACQSCERVSERCGGRCHRTLLPLSVHMMGVPGSNACGQARGLGSWESRPRLPSSVFQGPTAFAKRLPSSPCSCSSTRGIPRHLPVPRPVGHVMTWHGMTAASPVWCQAQCMHAWRAF